MAHTVSDSRDEQVRSISVVERASVAMLVAFSDGYTPEHVAPALATKIQTLPIALRRSLTWDQGL
jgi:transposase, IS30 family